MHFPWSSSLILMSLAPAPIASRYEDLAALFSEWRAFQKPRVVDGVPDYTANAMATPIAPRMIAARTPLDPAMRAATQPPATANASRWASASAWRS